MALVLAIASDTAPMAMLPFSTGSTGSGGTIGFSVKVSFFPGGKNRDKRFLSRAFDYDKTLFNALLTDVKKVEALRLERNDLHLKPSRSFCVTSLTTPQCPNHP